MVLFKISAKFLDGVVKSAISKAQCFLKALDYTVSMSRACKKPTTQEIWLFTTPSAIIFMTADTELLFGGPSDPGLSV